MIINLKEATSNLHRPKGALFIIILFFSISWLTRTVLLLIHGDTFQWDSSLLAVIFWGCLYDLGAVAYFLIPFLFLLILPAAHFYSGKIGRLTMFIAIFIMHVILIFNALAELVFWDEFGVRFNFLAVDYLIYTNEVLGNIRESYPIALIFSFIGALSLASTLLIWRTRLIKSWSYSGHEPIGKRLTMGLVVLFTLVFSCSFLKSDMLPNFENNYNRELAKNGIWSLFAAFWQNEISYAQFYKTIPEKEARLMMQHEMTLDGSTILDIDNRKITRLIRHDEAQESHPNIIQITVESLSAEFLGAFKPGSTLTPNLDKLASKSMFFENFYATGTRTVRGMEALTLSFPPTPGSSIIKRPHNEKMFTLGSVLRSRGYETIFAYGGFGYFDNMNYFFSNNGYRILDRNSVSSDDITFANIWGACDENLYDWVLRDADSCAKKNKPFHYFVMTTSNHRPYSFPDGRIDLPSKISGRDGAVKYTDFAIGKFLADCEKKSWYQNTIFVIVADHCASSAGRTALPIQNYHIPMFIYDPSGRLPSKHVKTLCSQMDYAPTLLGLLNWNYPSLFFGHDVMKLDPSKGHALMGTYQILGHLESNNLVELRPQREVYGHKCNLANKELELSNVDPDSIPEAISYYQYASYLYQNNLYNELSMAQLNQSGKLDTVRRF